MPRNLHWETRIEYKDFLEAVLNSSIMDKGYKKHEVYFYDGRTQVISTLEDGSTRKTLVILGLDNNSMILNSEKLLNGKTIAKDIETLNQAILKNGEHVVIRRIINDFDECTYSLSYVSDLHSITVSQDPKNLDFNCNFFDSAVTVEIEKDLYDRYKQGDISIDELQKHSVRRTKSSKRIRY